MKYTLIKNISEEAHWDIITPTGSKLVTVTNKPEAEKLVAELNKVLT